MARSLPQLLDFLSRLQGPTALGDLRAILADLQADVEDFAPHVRFSERTYRRNLVHAGPWHNLLVLCWRNRQRSPIHDHTGSSCAVRVLAGTMTETLFSRGPNGLIKAEGSRDFMPGAVIGSVDQDLHQISNMQTGNADLVTLHLYSPPLMIMGTYSLTDERRGEEPMFLDFGEAEGI